MSEIVDIENRKIIWFALSDLFLDTDISTSRDYIARTCAESKYSIAELYEILKNEVSPACAANLFSIAGEWGGFNEEWLEGRITQICSTKKTLRQYLYKLFIACTVGKDVEAEWAIISHKVKLLRGMV